MKVETQYNSSCTDEADRELLKRYREGDETAFEELVKTHAEFFKKCARRVMNKVSWARWDDVMRDVRDSFFQAAGKFDVKEPGSFDGYAYKFALKAFDSGEVRVTKRTLYENYRKVKDANDRLSKQWDRAPTYEELSDETGLTVRQVKTAIRAVAAFPMPLEEAEGVSGFEDPEQSQFASELMAKLSEEEADLFKRHALFGETFGEIANSIGELENTVRKRYGRVRKKLRRIMQDEGNRADGT